VDHLVPGLKWKGSADREAKHRRWRELIRTFGPRISTPEVELLMQAPR
jgi:hypothetical protein